MDIRDVPRRLAAGHMATDVEILVLNYFLPAVPEAPGFYLTTLERLNEIIHDPIT